MHFLIALIYFVLALFGIDGLGSQTVVIHSAVNGSDVLYSRTRINAGVAEFACIRSASGRCHYQLLPPDCAAPQSATKPAPACTPDHTRSFVLTAGASKELGGLPARFTLCVDQDNDRTTADCETLPAVDQVASRW